MEKFNLNQINKALLTLSEWSYSNNMIHKDISFDSYMDGIDFINRLALKAEEENHHPDLTIGWCKVGVTFTTHDSGGVTEKDIKMAKAVDSLIE